MPEDKAFQSTCPARGTTLRLQLSAPVVEISIHVPREGHDFSLSSLAETRYRFQSTCPARGTTGGDFFERVYLSLFQSTCPARGTT